MRYFLIIFFLLGIGSVSADEKTMLYDFRYWTAPDHTRIVVDTQENAFYDIVTSKEYIILMQTTCWRLKLKSHEERMPIIPKHE